MKIDYLFLCDKATVREGLLHVLGGGLRMLYRPAFPAPMGADLVVAMAASPNDFTHPHALEVTVRSADNKTTLIKADVAWTAPDDFDPGVLDQDVESMVPLIVPLFPIAIPAPGVYAINVRLDGKAARRLDFKAVLGGPPTMPQAVSETRSSAQ